MFGSGDKPATPEEIRHSNEQRKFWEMRDIGKQTNCEMESINEKLNTIIKMLATIMPKQEKV